MDQSVLFTCACLNVELRCEVNDTKAFENDHLKAILGGRLVLLEKPQRLVVSFE